MRVHSHGTATASGPITVRPTKSYVSRSRGTRRAWWKGKRHGKSDHHRLRPGRAHGGELRGPRQPRAPRPRRISVRRSVDADERRRKLSRLSPRDHRPRIDGSIPCAERLRSRGVSSCATCDGAFFRDRRIAVVGGGDSAMEEALFLTRFGKQITVIHRRDSLRASKIMAQRALDHPKISFIWDTVVEEVLGEEKVTGLALKNLKTGERTIHETDALFVAIGHDPNTAIFKGQ